MRCETAGKETQSGRLWRWRSLARRSSCETARKEPQSDRNSAEM